MPRGHPYMQSRFTRNLPSWSGQLHTNRNTNTRMLSERVGGGIVGGNGYVVPSLPPTVSRLALPKLSQRIARNAINAGVAPGPAPGPADEWRAISAEDGSDLPGTGTSVIQEQVALNGDGNIASVATLRFDGAGASGAGIIVYRFNTTDSSWNQLGNQPPGPNPNVGSGKGSTAALNQQGNGVIVGSHGGGAVVYQYDNVNNVWDQLAGTLSGPTQGTIRGISVALNGAGTIAIVGSVGGGAVAYQYNDQTDQWNQLGGTLPGNGANRGRSVALNAAGTRAIVGSGGGGAVAYQYNDQTDQWNQLGGVLSGPTQGTSQGLSVALNDAGTIAMVGSSGGGAVAYEYDGAAWNPLGGTLPGPTPATEQGISVALNAAGTIAIVGAAGSTNPAVSGGGAVAYEYDGAAWNPLGGTLLPSTQSSVTRNLVALNATGDRAIVSTGAPSGAVAYQYS